MKKQKWYLSVLLSFFLVGCNQTPAPSSVPEDPPPQPIDGPLLLDLELARDESVMTMVGNELLCSKGFAADDEMQTLYSSTLYSYHMDTGQSELLGYRNRFHMSSGSIACLNRSVFFYDGFSGMDYFYQVDLNSKKVTASSIGNQIYPLSYFSAGEDRIYLSKVEGGSHSYIEEFVPLTGGSRKVIEYFYDKEKEDGPGLLNFTYDDGKFYALIINWEDGKSELFLYVYDKEGEFQTRISLEGVTDINSHKVDRVEADDEYVFMTNFNDESVILKLEGDKARKIAEPERGLWLADGGYKNVSPLIAHRSEDGKIYYFDKESEELKEIPFESPVEGYVVSNVIRDDQNHLLIVLEAILDPDVSYTDETWPPKKLYYTTLEDLLRQPA